jgi:hypothetical protein
MKVKKNQNPSYILGYLLELIIKIWQFGKKYSLKSGEFGPFFPWKILCIGQNHIFQVKIWRNLGPKKRWFQLMLEHIPHDSQKPKTWLW